MPTAHATGPRTAAGKAVSSRNATRHGLLSAATVLGDHESAADWETFRAGTLRTLHPEGLQEIATAEHIAHLHWRLARVSRYEAEAINAARPSPAPYVLDPQAEEQFAAEDLDHLSATEQVEVLAARETERLIREIEAADRLLSPPGHEPHATRLLPDAPTIELIIRYEAHLSRDLTRSLYQFERLQAIRARHEQPAPAPPSAPSQRRVAPGAASREAPLHTCLATSQNCQTDPAPGCLAGAAPTIPPVLSPLPVAGNSHTRANHARSTVPVPATHSAPAPRAASAAPAIRLPAPRHDPKRKHGRRCNRHTTRAKRSP